MISQRLSFPTATLYKRAEARRLRILCRFPSFSGLRGQSRRFLHERNEYPPMPGSCWLCLNEACSFLFRLFPLFTPHQASRPWCVTTRQACRRHSSRHDVLIHATHTPCPAQPHRAACRPRPHALPHPIHRPVPAARWCDGGGCETEKLVSASWSLPRCRRFVWPFPGVEFTVWNARC